MVSSLYLRSGGVSSGRERENIPKSMIIFLFMTAYDADVRPTCDVTYDVRTACDVRTTTFDARRTTSGVNPTSDVQRPTSNDDVRRCYDDVRHRRTSWSQRRRRTSSSYVVARRRRIFMVYHSAHAHEGPEGCWGSRNFYFFARADARARAIY